MRHHRVVSSAALGLAVFLATSASAEVHFGHNVFIGGHDFSHQTYNRHHRLRVTLYDRPVNGAGCVTRRDGHGGTVRSCRLRRIPH